MAGRITGLHTRILALFQFTRQQTHCIGRADLRASRFAGRASKPAGAQTGQNIYNENEIFVNILTNIIRIYIAIFVYIAITKNLIDTNFHIDFTYFVIEKSVFKILISLNTRVFIIKMVIGLILKVIEIDKNNMYIKIVMV